MAAPPNSPHISDAMRQFLDGPCGSVFGATGPDGLPHAGYAWGVQPSPDGASLRVITEAGPAFSIGSTMAVTSADVKTYRTLQIKGIIRAAERPTPEDRYIAKVNIERFVAAVVEIDQFPPELIDLFPSVDFDVYVIDVDEIFDQSPGPHAGAAVDSTCWAAP